jgi:hypothetical protein
MFYAIFLLSYCTPRFQWLIAAWVVLIGMTNYLPITIAEVNLPPALQATLKVFLGFDDGADRSDDTVINAAMAN